MQLYMEEQVFDQSKFNDQSIASQSRLYARQVSPGSNVWVPVIAQLNELEDETDYLQLGQSDQREFYSVQAGDP